MIALPRPSLRCLAVWQRNLRVWRKILLPSALGNFGEPVLYLLAFGYGFGELVGDLGQLPYVAFLASGIVCSSTLFTASFEAMYSAFTRMANQQTWNAMLNAPLVVDDIVLGEVLWAATKGLLNSSAILIVAAAMGLVADWRALLALPVLGLAGFAFAACAMVVTAHARSFDFFLYFFTLGLTPCCSPAASSFRASSSRNGCNRPPSCCPCPMWWSWCGRCSPAAACMGPDCTSR